MTGAVLAAREPRARFRDLFAAEWLKLWSLRSTFWSLPAAMVAVVAFNVGTAWDHYRYWHAYGPAGRADFVAHGMALRDAFTGNAATVLVLCAAAMGAVAVTGEYAGGSIRTTFAAVPERGAVMSAKVLVVAAVQTLFGAAVAGLSFWLTQAVLAVRGAGVSLAHPGALRIVVASALLAPVCAVTGMALAAVVRRGSLSVVAAVVLLLFLPMALGERRHLTAVLAHTTPLRAWERLVATGPAEAVPHPWSTGGAWLVYGIWPVAAAVVTALVVRRRDQ
ncbi:MULTISPECIES: ABC transporter permease subunit [unclassified Streptomyces]|uniref:ABC transporter permease subunit n=1 Tax=unclassified Streptomyces TaxID=2593676 RepID=UPI0036BBA51C